MFLKWIKKHKKNFISYLFCAFAMALFTIISFSCKTYAYTIDSNGNLVGDNLINPNFSYNDEGIVCITNNQTIIINGTSTGNVFIDNSPSQITLNSGTYYFSIQNKENYNSNRILVFLQDSITSDRFYADIEQPFTINETKTYDITIRLQNATTFENCKFNIMLNKGNEPLEWEPYGIWYSQANYNNMEEQYNGLYEAQQNNNLYYAFNNAEAKLYNALLNTPYENQTPIVSGTITLNQDDYYINAYSSQQIANYLNTYDSETWNIFYYTIMYIPNMNFNNTFIVNVGDLTNDYNLTCYFTDGTSEIYNPRDLEDYVMIANKERKNIKYITIDIYMPDYVSFELQLSIDGTSYSTGYAQGYNNGYINGNNIGTNTAYENGKNYANANVNKESASYKAGYTQGKSDGLDISNNPNNSLYGMVIRS